MEQARCIQSPVLKNISFQGLSALTVLESPEESFFISAIFFIVVQL